MSAGGTIISFTNTALLRQDVRLPPAGRRANQFKANYRNGTISFRLPEGCCPFTTMLQTPAGHRVYAARILVTDENIAVFLTNLPPGLYILSVTATDGRRFTAPVYLAR